MAVLLIAKCSTRDKLNILKNFNLNISKNGDGSFSAVKEFGSKEEAQKHLKAVVNGYLKKEQPNYADLYFNMNLSILQGYLAIEDVSAVIFSSETLDNSFQYNDQKKHIKKTQCKA